MIDGGIMEGRRLQLCRPASGYSCWFWVSWRGFSIALSIDDVNSHCTSHTWLMSTPHCVLRNNRPCSSGTCVGTRPYRQHRWDHTPNNPYSRQKPVFFAWMNRIQSRCDPGLQFDGETGYFSHAQGEVSNWRKTISGNGGTSGLSSSSCIER